MQGVINGILFGVEEYAAKHMTSSKDRALYRHLKTGMVAGFAQGFVCAPMELVKLHTMHKKIGEVGHYPGNLETLKMIWKKEGMRGCYRGLTVTMVRDVSGYGVYFAIYEGLMDAYVRKQNIPRQEIAYAVPFILGGLAGVASWACNYPVDFAKTGFQLDGINGTEHQYRSSWDVLIKAWKRGGVQYLYTGFVPSLVRAFAFSMFTFPVVEFVKKNLSPDKQCGVM